MPEPFCWAPPPPEVTTTVHRHLESWRATRPNEEVDLEWTSAFRADPSMVFVAAPLGHPVVLEGCTPAGTARFHLPNVRVLADFAVDGRSGTLDLEARRIVLMPEESRFYIVFHTFARLRARAAGGERSLRLRLE